MKDNFDFIKEKFDAENITAPNDIGTDFVMSKINDKSTKRVKFPTKKVIGGLASMVACVAVVAIAINSLAPSVITPAPVIAEASELITFDNYDSIKSTLKDMGVGTRTEHNIDQMKGEIVNMLSYSQKYDSDAVSDESISESSDSFGQTYLQVDGVDEGDIVKTDGEYIYVATSNEIRIHSAKGANSEEMDPIDISGEIFDMYLNGDNIIVNTYFYSDDKTVTTIYDKSNAKKVKKLDEFAQSGYYTSSRMIGSNIYVVTDQLIHTQDDVPYVTCKGKKAKLNAKSISCVEDPTDAEYLVITRIDTADLSAETETKAILGASSNVYCNMDNMFITGAVYTTPNVKKSTGKNGVTIDTIEDDDIAYYMPAPTQQTEIIKVSLGESIQFVATAKVNGHIYSQYAMDERNGNLRIATTSTDDNGKDVNNLFILDDKLQPLGKVDGFAPTESIKAVKYVGDTAYVITYEQTDPLFVIDLSNPKKPAILGECKIDGFSTMLVPIGDDKLMGIGYYTEDHTDDDIDMEITEGIKLALFDISDKTNPKVIDEKVLKGYSSSVQWTPKALMHHSERNTYIIPFGSDDYVNNKAITGALEFSVSGSKFTDITRYTIANDDYDTIERCTYVNDDLYMFTWNGEMYSSILK